MADIEIKKLQEMVENYNSGAGSYAYLLDGNGAVIAHPDRKQVAELYNYKTMKKNVLLRDANGKMIKDAKNNEVTEEINFEVTPSLQAIVAKAMAGEIGVGQYITGLLTQPVDGTGDILATILNNAVQLLSAVTGYIGLFDDGGNHFYIHHGSGIDPEIIIQPQPTELGLHGHVYVTGEIFCVEDYRIHPQRIYDNMLDSSTSSVIMVPLKQDGKVRGILAVSWANEIHPVNKEDLEGLRELRCDCIQGYGVIESKGLVKMSAN